MTGTPVGISASMISPTTYVPGSNVTLTLKGKAAASTSVSVETVSAGGVALPSKLVAEFIESN